MRIAKNREQGTGNREQGAGNRDRRICEMLAWRVRLPLDLVAYRVAKRGKCLLLRLHFFET
jgi:hypothetical protein